MNKEEQYRVHNQTHLNNGGRIFLPQWRIRKRRWEESVAAAQAKREGRKFEMSSQPFNCTCGSINCLGDFTCKRPENEQVIEPRRKRKSETLTPREAVLVDREW